MVQPTIPQSPQPAHVPTIPVQAAATSTSTSSSSISISTATATSPSISVSSTPTATNTTTMTMTDTEDHDLSSESDTSITKNTLDEDDEVTGDFSGEEEEELDFVVSALNVFNALEDLRGVTQKGFSVKKFNKASHVVLSSTATLLDVSQNMSLVQSTPRLRGALESLVIQLRQLQSGPLIQETVMGKLETHVCELEEAVGECVDEFRSTNNPFESSMTPARDVGDTPPSPRRRPISKDDSFRETADKKVLHPSLFISPSPPFLSSHCSYFAL